MTWIDDNKRPLMAVGAIMGVAWFGGRYFDKNQTFNVERRGHTIKKMTRSDVIKKGNSRTYFNPYMGKTIPKGMGKSGIIVTKKTDVVKTFGSIPKIRVVAGYDSKTGEANKWTEHDGTEWAFTIDGVPLMLSDRIDRGKKGLKRWTISAGDKDEAKLVASAMGTQFYDSWEGDTHSPQRHNKPFDIANYPEVNTSESLDNKTFNALDMELDRNDCCEVWVEKLYDDGKIGFGQAGDFLFGIETGDLKCSSLGSPNCSKHDSSAEMFDAERIQYNYTVHREPKGSSKGGWFTSKKAETFDAEGGGEMSCNDKLNEAYDWIGFHNGEENLRKFMDSIGIKDEDLDAETFEAKGDCAECYGTGGLYDSHMGINDECHSCGGTGFDY